MSGSERLGIQIFHHGMHKRIGTHLPVADNPHVCNCCGIHLWPGSAERECDGKERAGNRWRGGAVCTQHLTLVPGPGPYGPDVQSHSSNSLLTKQVKFSYPSIWPRRTWGDQRKSDILGERHLKNPPKWNLHFPVIFSPSSTLIFFVINISHQT